MLFSLNSLSVWYINADIFGRVGIQKATVDLMQKRITAFLVILAAVSSCSLQVRRHNEIPMYVSEEARDLIGLVNRYRERHGLPELEWDSNLYFVCQAHCRDMLERDYFSHYTPEYLSPFDRLHLARFEYIFAGENLAHGQMSPEKVFSDWLRSPPHKRNIESLLYTHQAVAYDPVGHYWTHMFINYGTEYMYAIRGFCSIRVIRHRTLL